MERYKEYKDSGIQWIGVIPSHWEERRHKYCLSLVKTKSSSSNKVGLENIESFTGRYISTETTYDGDGVDANEGDILYGKLRPYLAKVWIAERPCNAVGDFYVYRCDETVVLRRFAKWLMLSDAFTNICSASTYGAKMPRVSSDFIASLSIPIPPLHEQERIVNFIECKTTKIDAYIAEKEKEVQLLNELKEGEIAKVVTQGLNPNVKMKDSGISWIGMIPEHWETKRAKFMFFKNKRARRSEDEVITCFRDGQVTLRKNRRITGFTESEKYDGYQGIRKGDLVIHQMDAFAGSIGVSDSDGMGTSVYHCCTPIGDYNVYYYAYLIRQMALSGFIQSLYKGIRERSSDFSFPVFGNQYLTIPPRVEQDAIVTYINEKCSKINSLVSELESEIEYLKEYKQRLIADCVTGQVNVQNIE